MIDYPKDMPCWAPGAAEYLETLLTGNEMTWEWGGGESSVWLHNRVKFIHVMESNPKWRKFVLERTDPKRCRVLLAPTNSLDYLHHHKALKVVPDLWLIDGYMRIDCLKVVEREAAPSNLVVLDDALDYAEHLLKGEWDIKRFAMPHPYADIPINHAKYGHLRNTVRKKHAKTKETWICRCSKKPSKIESKATGWWSSGARLLIGALGLLGA